MLLFIAVLLIFQLPYVHFNTSHVTVYLGGNGMITKMMRFQYISCYCLSQVPCQETARSCISIHLMLLFIKSQKIFFFNHFPFQYISCYCLSFLSPNHLPCIILFQYISCYCLSNELTPFYIFLRI